MAGMVPVIDIAKWQGAVNFAAMRSRGVQGVIVRLGNGTAFDGMASTYVPAAKAAGLVVGGYWFCNPRQDATGAAQMARFAKRARQLETLDIPPMMDVENYTREPGSLPVLTDARLQAWLEDGVDQLIREFGRPPILYSNAAYFGSVGLRAGTLNRCPLIAARYPWYFVGSPQPPADATRWETWLMSNTTKRPQIPAGFARWDGWQFSAGFNRMGATYGASSTDIDLNLIRADAWENWTHIVVHPDPPAPPVEDVPPVPPPPVIPPPAPQTLIEEDTVQYIADSDTMGSALITFVTTKDNIGSYRMAGITGDVRNMATIDGKIPAVHWPDAIYAERAANAYRG